MRYNSGAAIWMVYDPYHSTGNITDLLRIGTSEITECIEEAGIKRWSEVT